MRSRVVRRGLVALTTAAAVGAGLWTGLSPANATVTFARQYRLPCSTCHTVFPQLNDFGRAFLLNSFRIPGQEKEARLAWQHTIPFSIQVKGTLSYDTQADPKFGHIIDEIQLHSSGLMSKQDAFYLHHHLQEAEHAGDTYEGWIQHAFPSKQNVSLRLGQFEQPLAFSPEIQIISHSGYLIYDAAVGLDDFAFATAARGLLVQGGALGDGTRFALSINQARRFFGGAGSPTVQYTEPKFGNLFFRVQQQIRGNRFGLFTDLGRTQVVTDQGRFMDHFYRLGLDAEARRGKWRAYALWLTGRHSNPGGTGQRGGLNGGFVGLDRSLSPRLLAYVRYDRAHSSGPFGTGTDEGPTVGVTGLIAQNWRLVPEYQHRRGNGNAFFLSTHLAF